MKWYTWELLDARVLVYNRKWTFLLMLSVTGWSFSCCFSRTWSTELCPLSWSMEALLHIVAVSVAFPLGTERAHSLLMTKSGECAWESSVTFSPEPYSIHCEWAPGLQGLYHSTADYNTCRVTRDALCPAPNSRTLVDTLKRHVSPHTHCFLSLAVW